MRILFLICSATFLNITVLAADNCDQRPETVKILNKLVEIVYLNNPTTLHIQQWTKSAQTPLDGSPNNVDQIKWCHCLFNKKAARFGVSIAEKLNDLDPKHLEKYDQWLKSFPEKEAGLNSVAISSLEAICYNEAYIKVKDKVSTLNSFDKLMTSPFKPGIGIAGLTIGDPASKIIDLLGPCLSIKKSKISNTFNYGPTFLGLELTASPTGFSSSIRKISLGTNFKGEIGYGIHFGDSRLDIQNKMKNEKVEKANIKEIIFKNGMFFHFDLKTSKLVQFGLMARI